VYRSDLIASVGREPMTLMSPRMTIPELRQLVERELAQNATRARYARVAFVHRVASAHRLGADDHRAQLEQLEVGAVPANPCLAVQHAATVFELHGKRGDAEQRRGEHESRARDKDVGSAVHETRQRTSVQITRKPSSAVSFFPSSRLRAL
jgi:hypothetical protein